MRFLIVDYLIEKHCKEDNKVCAVGVISTYRIKGAFRDIASHFKIDFMESTKVTAILDAYDDIEGMSFEEFVASLDVPVSNDENAPKTFKAAWSLKEEEREYLRTMVGRYNSIFKYAVSIVGKPKTWGQHAAAVIISPMPLKNCLPTRRSKKTGDVVSQFDMKETEWLGMLKADLLGLTNLSKITVAHRLIKERHGIDIDIYKLADEHATQAMWDMLAKGDTLGLFQIAGKGMTECIMRLKPQSIEELSVIIALYRPGILDAGMLPEYIGRARGEKAIPPYLTPAVESILGETYNIIVYQEQSMRICMEVAGYDSQRADEVRSYIGKKKMKQLLEEEPFFVEGCVKTSGLSEADAKALFDQISAGGRYSFNKSHSYSYAMIAFVTSWLKCYYPIEFYCACMMTVDFDELKNYIREAKRKGIYVQFPSVTDVHDDWSVVDDHTILIGISSISGVGEAALKSIVKEAPYVDFEDFKARSGADSRVMTALINIGFFRDWYPNSADLLHRFKSNDTSANLFGASLEERFTEEQPPYTKKELIEIETELLGIPITYDPYEVALESVEKYASQLVTMTQMRELPYEMSYNILCKLVDTREIRTKREDRMCFLSVDCDGEQVDITCFPKEWAKFSKHAEKNRYYIFNVKKSEYNGKDSYAMNKFMQVQEEQEK